MLYNPQDMTNALLDDTSRINCPLAILCDVASSAVPLVAHEEHDDMAEDMGYNLFEDEPLTVVSDSYKHDLESYKTWKREVAQYENEDNDPKTQVGTKRAREDNKHEPDNLLRIERREHTFLMCRYLENELTLARLYRKNKFYASQIEKCMSGAGL